MTSGRAADPAGAVPGVSRALPPFPETSGAGGVLLAAHRPALSVVPRSHLAYTRVANPRARYGLSLSGQAVMR